MFGEYRHSGWNGEVSFARYRWRGKEWFFPTGPLERSYSDSALPSTKTQDTP